MKVFCAPMEITLGHPEKNATAALFLIEANKTADYILLPPLFLTGCTCGDLFKYAWFCDRQTEQLARIISAMPDRVRIVTTIMEDCIEKPIVFDSDGIIDLYDINIATDLDEIKVGKTNFLCTKHKWTIGSIDELIYQLKDTVTYFVSAGKGESSARHMHSGIAGAVIGEVYTCRQNENILIDDMSPFEQVITEPKVFPDPMYPFVPGDTKYLDEAIDILSAALRRRLDHIGSDKVVIGISGGLDSTLALLIAANTIPDKNNIIGITMPGLGTTNTTRSNANMLMNGLKVQSRTIPIEKAVLSHFNDIGHDTDEYDITYENAQARERMQILFDVCNMEGAINIGTGDLSEAMLGFTTFGGDHLSMYGLNSGVPKTLVRALVLRFAQRLPQLSSVLTDIATSPISPELLPGLQETEAIVGSYKANDFAIYYTIVKGMGRKQLQSLLDMVELHLDLDAFYRRITSAQFKRNCSADGVQVVMCSVMPKGDFNLPSDIKNVF